MLGADTKVCLICRKNCGFRIYKHIILSFESASMISEAVPPSFSPKDTISVVCLLPLYLYSNVKLVPPSINTRLFRVTRSSSSVCPAILQMTLLFLPKQTYLPSPSPLLPTSLFPPPPPQAVNPPLPLLLHHFHPLPHSAPASLPALCSLSKRHFPPPFQSSTPILPLVSLMNGFTAGKVLIFIPLSDFCWLLLISNTQRKATESINKEMNTLHPAIHTAVHPGCGPSEKASSAFIPIELSVTLESSVLLFFFFFLERIKVVSMSVASYQTLRQRGPEGHRVAQSKYSSEETCSVPSHLSSFTLVHH